MMFGVGADMSIQIQLNLRVAFKDKYFVGGIGRTELELLDGPFQNPFDLG